MNVASKTIHLVKNVEPFPAKQQTIFMYLCMYIPFPPTDPGIKFPNNIYDIFYHLTI